MSYQQQFGTRSLSVVVREWRLAKDNNTQSIDSLWCSAHKGGEEGDKVPQQGDSGGGISAASVFFVPTEHKTKNTKEKEMRRGGGNPRQ